MAWRSTRAQWELEKGLARTMRHAPTAAERKLWKHLRGRQLAGMSFRRQHVIGRFIVDFFCPEQRLVLEIDGGVHEGRLERDAERTRTLEALGLRVLRFSNLDVLNDTHAVVLRIAAAAIR